MKADKARLLAARSREDGRRARLALRRLLRAGDRGDPAAIEVLWARWFREPDTDIWAVLARQRRPLHGDDRSRVALGMPVGVDVVVRVACHDGHPVGDIARARILAGDQELVDAACAAATVHPELAIFCAEHRLAPSDPHRRAVFFLLTGQREEYLLADPDHSLLAVAYRGAREDERAAIRTRVAGEPELVRVLAESNRGDRMTRLSEPEAEYLTGQFARRRDWAGLWALAKDLPVCQAIDAARLIEGWSPGREDAFLFTTLTRADPDLMAVARAALSPTHIEAPGRVVDCAFAPDGTRFAVAHDKGVDVYALPSGRREKENSRRGTDIRAVLALDDALVITAGLHSGGGPVRGFVERGGGGRPVTRTVVDGVIRALGRRPGGYVALTLRGEQIQLCLRDDDGRPDAPPDARLVPIGAGLPTPYTGRWWLATDPTGDRIVVSGDRLHLLSVSGSTVHLDSSMPTNGQELTVAVSGPDRMVTLAPDRTLQVWHHTEVVATRRLDHPVLRASLVDLPCAGAIAVLPSSWSDRVLLLDGETLTDTDTLTFDGMEITGLYGMRNGDLVAVTGGSSVELVDLADRRMAVLVDRPLGATTPADLNAVRDYLDRAAPGSRPVLELLRDCLDHRFGEEVALGTSAVPDTRSDGIALGGG